MQPLPSIRFPHEQQLAGIPAMAALMGCPRHLLWLCDRKAPEDLKIHTFEPLTVVTAGGLLDLTAARQYERLHEVVAGPLFDPPGLIVLNVNEVGAGEQLLYHLLCLVAARRIEGPDPRLDFSYCGTTELDPAQGYLTKPRHVLAWGPVSGLATGHRHQQAIEFVMGFSHHTRILMVAADDISEMLDRLRLAPDRIFLFNLGSKHVRRETKRKEVKKKIESTKTKRRREGVTIG